MIVPILMVVGGEENEAGHEVELTASLKKLAQKKPDTDFLSLYRPS